MEIIKAEDQKSDLRTLGLSPPPLAPPPGRPALSTSGQHEVRQRSLCLGSGSQLSAIV